MQNASLLDPARPLPPGPRSPSVGASTLQVFLVVLEPAFVIRSECAIASSHVVVFAIALAAVQRELLLPFNVSHMPHHEMFGTGLIHINLAVLPIVQSVGLALVGREDPPRQQFVAEKTWLPTRQGRDRLVGSGSTCSKNFALLLEISGRSCGDASP